MPIAEARHVSLSAAAKEDRSILSLHFLDSLDYSLVFSLFPRMHPDSRDAFESRVSFIYSILFLPLPLLLHMHSRRARFVARAFWERDNSSANYARRYRAARGLRIALLEPALFYLPLTQSKKKEKREKSTNEFVAMI